MFTGKKWNILQILCIFVLLLTEERRCAQVIEIVTEIVEGTKPPNRTVWLVGSADMEPLILRRRDEKKLGGVKKVGEEKKMGEEKKEKEVNREHKRNRRFADLFMPPLLRPKDRNYNFHTMGDSEIWSVPRSRLLRATLDGKYHSISDALNLDSDKFQRLFDHDY